MNEVNISVSGKTKGVSLSLAQMPNAGSINLEHDMSRYYSLITEQYANEAKQASEEIQALLSSLSIVTTNEMQTITGDKSFTGNLTAQTPNTNDNSRKVATTEFVKNVASGISATMSTLADKNFSNLSTVGEARLHALKSYRDSGELLTDSEGLEDVKDYAHSTFDLSKFTVVGSPIVTSDGIASGFSSSNYLQVDEGYDLTKRFKLNAKIITGNTVSEQHILGWSNQTFMMFIYNSKLCFGYSNTQMYNNNATVEVNKTYDVEFEYFGNGTATFKYKEENSTDYVVVNESNITPYASILNDFRIGRSSDNNIYFNGSIDLKEVNITVDGIPVFSGNKTGIDTIKADDYTLTGTASVSDDGIITFADFNNYVISPQITLSNDFDISWSGTKESDKPFQATYFFNSSGTTEAENIVISVFQGSNGNFFLAIPSLYSDNIIRYFDYNGITNYTIRLSFKNNNYKLEIKPEGNNYTTVISGTSTENMANVAYVRFNSAGYDLNSFKVYTDGSLVYQPCLKIPYTESKTGSKIVNAVYRDRVNDMYNQFGYAPYYTLSDSDFTLPQGELYGLIQRFSADRIMPDYGNAISISDSSYTAPNNGYILGVWSGMSNSSATIKIDDVTVAYGTCADSYGSSALIPIAKNSVAQFTNVDTKKFVPTKGF